MCLGVYLSGPLGKKMSRIFLLLWALIAVNKWDQRENLEAKYGYRVSRAFSCDPCEKKRIQAAVRFLFDSCQKMKGLGPQDQQILRMKYLNCQKEKIQSDKILKMIGLLCFAKTLYNVYFLAKTTAKNSFTNPIRFFLLDEEA